MKKSLLFTLIFCSLFSLLSCRSNRDGRNDRADETTVAAPDTAGVDQTATPNGCTNTASRVNVYIENSGSMNGYINGATEFKAAMADLLVMLEYRYSKDSVSLYFINTAVHPIARPASSATFASQLNATNFRVGNVGSTNLNDIFKLILSKTDPKTISILLSDCIYSAKGNNATHLLGIAKASTKGEFLQKSKLSNVGYTTTIVKLSSNFQGTYYDRFDKPHQHSGQRPYYLCVIGTADAMADFNAVVPLKKDSLKGFESSYTLSSNANANTPFWSILPAKYPARFAPAKGKSTSKYIRAIEDIQINARDGGALELRVAVDMSGYAVDESYLLLPANYAVTKGDFSITEIAPISQVSLMQNDQMYAKSATHIIYLQANGTAYSDIELEFKNQIPQWVYQTSVEDDAHGVDDDKTFGIKYMVEGIAEAYSTQTNNGRFFTLNAPIQKSQGMSVLGIFGIILLIAGIGFVGVLIYKRNN